MLHYNPRLKALARNLRSNQTDSEQLLWSRIRRKQVMGVQFLRQRPLGQYIVDFYSPKARLVVEVDGSQHHEPTNMKKDMERDQWLKDQGLTVLRFSGLEVLKELDGVLQVIYDKVKETLNIPPEDE